MRIISVNVGRARPLDGTDTGAGPALSAIIKTPVSTLAHPVAIPVGLLGLEADEQADLSVHGGRDKAVYGYPVEHYPVWRTMRSQATGIDVDLPHGAMGENLTIEGLLEVDLWIGDTVLVGAVDGHSGSILRIASPRSPCYKFNARMGFKQAAKMMVQSAYTGYYLEVLKTGTVAAGDRLRVIPGERVMRVDEQHRYRHRPSPRDGW